MAYPESQPLKLIRSQRYTHTRTEGSELPGMCLVGMQNMEKDLYFKQQKRETAQMSTNKYIVYSCHGMLQGNEKASVIDAGDADSH